MRLLINGVGIWEVADGGDIYLVYLVLVNDLKTIVSKARSKAFAAVNYSLVERNWRIGKRIVEEEQNGEARDWYAKEAFEQGWSFRTLNRNINTLYYDR